MSSYAASFYAGGDPTPRPVRIELAPDSLSIYLEGAAAPLLWQRATLQFQDNAVAGGAVRITSPASGPGSLLMVSDLALLAALGRRRASGASGLAIGLAVFAGGSLALLAAGYFWFLPWIAGVMARRVPASVEQQIGRMALDQMAPEARRCQEEAVRRPVRAIVDKLALVAPKMDYAFQLFIVKDNTVNAFATPGGYVVVYTGLLEKTKSPEELAAVLAHEVTHVTGRHGTEGVLRAATFWVMLSFLIGDPSGILIQAAGAFSELSYRRGQEEAADRGAMALFEKARIDPRGLTGAFEMLGKETPELPAAARWFSTHPRTEDRLAEIRKWARDAHYRPEPLLPGGTVWPPRGCSP